MTLLCFASQKGSPGTTAVALAVAAALEVSPGRRKLLMEADTTGGTLAIRYRLPVEPGLVTLAAGVRAGIEPEGLWRHAQELPGGLPVVVCPDGPEQVHAALAASGAQLGRFLNDLRGVDVICDVGRLAPDSPALDFAAQASAVLMVARPTAEQLQPAARRMAMLRPRVGNLGWVLIGQKPHGPAEVETTFDFPVVGVIADDRRSVTSIEAGAMTKRIRRHPFVRSSATLAATLADWLAPLTRAAPDGGVGDPALADERHRSAAPGGPAPATTGRPADPASTELRNSKPAVQPRTVESALVAEAAAEADRMPPPPPDQASGQPPPPQPDEAFGQPPPPQPDEAFGQPPPPQPDEALHPIEQRWDEPLAGSGPLGDRWVEPRSVDERADRWAAPAAGEWDHGDSEHGESGHGESDHGDSHHGNVDHGESDHGDSHHGNVDHGESDHGESAGERLRPPPAFRADRSQVADGATMDRHGPDDDRSRVGDHDPITDRGQEDAEDRDGSAAIGTADLHDIFGPPGPDRHRPPARPAPPAPPSSTRVPSGVPAADPDPRAMPPSPFPHEERDVDWMTR